MDSPEPGREELLERIKELESGLKEEGARRAALESGLKEEGAKSAALERRLKEKDAESGKTASLFEFSEKGLRLKLYRLLVKKYAEQINEREKKTIGEVKGLVTAEDLTIQSIASELKPEQYDFEKHYIGSAEKAFQFVQKEIRFVKADIPISYFLSPLEIMTEKVADDEDQAVFLCSVLAALGDEGASVVIAEMFDLTTHAFVLISHSGKAFFLDPTQEHEFAEFSGSMREVMKDYSFRGKKIRKLLYKFNNVEYKSFIEEE